MSRSALQLLRWCNPVDSIISGMSYIGPLQSSGGWHCHILISLIYQHLVYTPCWLNHLRSPLDAFGRPQQVLFVLDRHWIAKDSGPIIVGSIVMILFVWAELWGRTFQCTVGLTHLDCPQYTGAVCFEKVRFVMFWQHGPSIVGNRDNGPLTIKHNHHRLTCLRWGALASGKLDGSRLQVEYLEYHKFKWFKLLSLPQSWIYVQTNVAGEVPDGKPRAKRQVSQ